VAGGRRRLRPGDRFALRGTTRRPELPPDEFARRIDLSRYRRLRLHRGDGRIVLVLGLASALSGAAGTGRRGAQNR
jgi:hypothetical protein